MPPVRNASARGAGHTFGYRTVCKTVARANGGSTR